MFSSDNDIQRELNKLGLERVVQKYYTRFAILYKLRSEHLNRLEKALIKALRPVQNILNRKKPAVYVQIPIEGQSPEVVTLVELRNAIVSNTNSLYKRIDIERVIETFDYYLQMILPIDKKIEQNKALLKPVSARVKTLKTTTFTPNSVSHIASLTIKDTGNPAASAIFDTFLQSKRFIQEVNNYIEEQAEPEIEEAIFEVARGKKGKKTKKNSGQFRSKFSLKKMQKNFASKVKGFLGRMAPKTIELIGFDNFQEQVPEFFSILELINSKLRMAIISNMGRPSLVNRTGRFASSARITKVTRSENDGINLTYTYQRNPYSVFEQEIGKAPWNRIPERDPKTIIEKSLRQLAQEAAIAKFGLEPTFNREF